MTPAIALSDVTVVRGQREILSHVSWNVDEGQRWVVMGPNGAGKTTLMQICSGYMHPTSGSAIVLGEKLGATNVRDLRPRIGISSSATAGLLPPQETVSDAVVTAAYGVSGRWRERYEAIDHERAHTLIESWGLADLKDRRIGTLSEGERKRTHIARSLMADPEILILDEPAAGLDVAGREELVNRLSALAADDRSPVLILVTHHVEEIPPHFTHALLVSNGQVSAQGLVHDMIASEPMSKAFNTPLIVEHFDQRWYARGWEPSRGKRAL